MDTSPTFVDWDGRPAILFSAAKGDAVAILEPGGSWTAVDAMDVADSGKVVASEDALKLKFESVFGSFEVPIKSLNA